MGNDLYTILYSCVVNKHSNARDSLDFMHVRNPSSAIAAPSIIFIITIHRLLLRIGYLWIFSLCHALYFPPKLNVRHMSCCHGSVTSKPWSSARENTAAIASDSGHAWMRSAHKFRVDLLSSVVMLFFSSNVLTMASSAVQHRIQVRINT